MLLPLGDVGAHSVGVSNAFDVGSGWSGGGERYGARLSIVGVLAGEGVDSVAATAATANVSSQFGALQGPNSCGRARSSCCCGRYCGEAVDDGGSDASGIWALEIGMVILVSGKGEANNGNSSAGMAVKFSEL